VTRPTGTTATDPVPATETPKSDHGTRSESYRVPAIVCAGAALLLRLGAAADAFWLDEIWTLANAQQMRSLFDVFTLAHDNNHQLVSLWMYLLGDVDPLLLRLPSILAGSAAVFFAVRLSRNLPPMAHWFVGTVFSCAYLLVVYSSEARGYGLAVCFALASLDVFKTYVDRPGPKSIAAFSSLVVLGMMSHFGFVQFYLALVLWHLWLARHRVSSLVPWHVVPASYLLYLYLVIYRRMEIGGGSEQIDSVLVQAAAWGLGTPVTQVAVTIAVGLALALFVTDQVRLHRAGRSEWVFNVLMVIVVPPVIAWVTQQSQATTAGGGDVGLPIYPRYFLLSLSFLLLSVCRAAHWLYTRNHAVARVFGVAVVLWLCATSVTRVVPFLQYGRGDYRSVVETMVAKGRLPIPLQQDPTAPGITYGGDHPFRTNAVIEYYRRYEGEKRRLLFVHNDAFERDPRYAPEFFLVHRGVHEGADGRVAFPEAVRVPSRVGAVYRFVQSFRHHAPSGWTWALYQRVSRPRAIKTAPPRRRFSPGPPILM
jgi:hypothetical protein